MPGEKCQQCDNIVAAKIWGKYAICGECLGKAFPDLQKYTLPGEATTIDAMRAELEAATDRARSVAAAGGMLPNIPCSDAPKSICVGPQPGNFVTAFATREEWEAAAAKPTPVDDLAKRIKMLRESGARAYKDGPLELIFAPAPKNSLTLSEMALADRATADSTR